MKTIQVCFFFLLLFCWRYAISALSDTMRFFISTPADVLVFVGENIQSLMKDFGITFWQMLWWLSLSLLSSYLLVVLISYYPKIYNAVFPLFVMTQIIPMITFAPLIIVVFGLGVISKIIIASLLSFFPLFLSLYDWLKHIPREYRDLLSLYKTSKRTALHRVFFPLALPSFFTGLKVAISAALIGTIVAEFSWAYFGLGKNLLVASRTLDAELMMASLIGIGLIWWVCYGLSVLIEKKSLYRK